MTQPIHYTKRQRNKKSGGDIRQELMENLSIILTTPSLNDQTVANAINFAIYNWTEAYGKYEGNEYWSSDAYFQFAYEKNRAHKLIHEHIVPRRWIQESVLVLENKSPLSLYLFFQKYVIGAVITKAEDELFHPHYCGYSLTSRMPEEFTDKDHEWYDNPWCRYLAVNLQNDNVLTIYKVVEWKGKKEGEGKDEIVPFLGIAKDVADGLM